MVKIFKAQSKPRQQQIRTLDVEELSLSGQGVAFLDGKPVMVSGVIPGEQVKARITADKRRVTQAVVEKVLQASPHRQAPFCPHFKHCGGCDLQFMPHEQQVGLKQQALASYLQRQLGETDVEQVAAITDADRAYRRRARLSVRVNKKNKQLEVGFRARQSADICDIDACPMLVASLQDFPLKLKTCFQLYGLANRVGHAELVHCDQGDVVLLRLTQTLTTKQEQGLVDFAKQHNVTLVLDEGKNAISWLAPDEPVALTYTLATDKPLALAFVPGGFIQVNAKVNQKMLEQALDWLDLQATDKVLDLFCGVGNFSLPVAQVATSVVGVEGLPELTEQAKANAAAAKLENTEFYCADLSQNVSESTWWKQKYDKLLLDPARAGAFELVQQLSPDMFARIVYVSCNPASMIRDAKVLTENGYRMVKIGAMDMFPQTGHLECMALFVKK